ncbi:unnamed protein product [Auanema sp. JU1783]|nr:unnamed protein product [Auanema sp. JU1783]
MDGSSVSEVAHTSFQSDHEALSPEASTSRAEVAHADYHAALQEFESLAQKYESQVGDLTEGELIAFEAQLIRLLSRVLISRPPPSRSTPLKPRLTDWLKVIGLSPTNIRHLELCGVHDVLAMIQKPQKETNLLAERGRYSPESKRKILRSCDIANSYLEALKGRRESSFTDKQLSWSVYSPKSSKAGAWRDTSAESASPPSSRFLLAPVEGSSRGDEDRESPYFESDPCTAGSFPCTPNVVSGHSRTASGSGSLSVLSTRSTLSPSSPLTSSAHSAPTSTSGGRIVQSTSMQLNMKLPKQSRLEHDIPHKWQRSTKYFLRSGGDGICRLCKRSLGFGFLTSWEKCRACKLKVHTQCKSKIGDTCGLTTEHIRLVFDRMVEQNIGDMWNDPPSASIPSSRSFNEPAFQYPENAGVVDSSSSTNSSAPSTPAFPLNMGMSSPYAVSGQSRTIERKFTFPDTVPEVPDIVLPDTTSDPFLNSISTQSTSIIGDGSEGTLVADSTGSANTDFVNSDESGSKSVDNRLDRNQWQNLTIRGANTQASWNEVTIPIGKIEFKRNCLLGKGRFGTVRHGFYFGDVAVKYLNMDHVEEGKRLEQFKADVVAHKNTRHDNIVLFYGFCQENDRYGIVTSLCKGRTLYQAIHEFNERLEISVVLQLATQVCQGISYLHTKNIIHKDLRSKNIFIESKNKVVITDSGIFDPKRLAYPKRNNSFLVPSHWLAYLAPELIRSLSSDLDTLPFSESTDVYAFSTIWYELLTYSFPWAWEHPDTIMWMVGNGMKAPMHNIKAIREVKELLMRCWSYYGSDRPSFSEILNALINLPRKRLDRSPSFPAMRSYESLF